MLIHIYLFLDIYGYHGNKMQPFLKITVAYPKLIAPAQTTVGGRAFGAAIPTPGIPDL